ncbi:MAG: hypothetical protein KDK37_13235 [Leptospiraceae bacterium]|nr:hypothetical protein [Leptospiraceae bacterium]
MDQWSAFFATKIGRIVLSLIASAATFVNCGGNNVLHRSVDLVEPSAKTVKSLLPHSWIILIPPLHLEFFSIWMLPETLQKDINKVNANLKQVWNPRVINPTDLVDKDADGHPDFGSLKDPIHYSTKIVFQIQSRIEGLLVDR